MLACGNPVVLYFEVCLGTIFLNLSLQSMGASVTNLMMRVTSLLVADQFFASAFTVLHSMCRNSILTRCFYVLFQNDFCMYSAIFLFVYGIVFVRKPNLMVTAN